MAKAELGLNILNSSKSDILEVCRWSRLNASKIPKSLHPSHPTSQGHGVLQVSHNFFKGFLEYPYILKLPTSMAATLASSSTCFI